MLDKKKFQAIITNFYDISNKDRLFRLCRTIYRQTYFLSISQFEHVLDLCVEEMGCLHISPKMIGDVTRRVYPYDKSIVAKQREKRKEIELETNIKKECFMCENKGFFSAKSRRPDINGHDEQTFLCNCEIGQNSDLNMDIWDEKFLKDFIPRYEEISHFAKIEAVKELLPNHEKKQETSFNLKSLDNEIFKHLGSNNT